MLMPQVFAMPGLLTQVSFRWRPYIYTVDNQSHPLHTPDNKGKEGMAYLTFIIDNYESLPGIVAFIHSHRDGYPVAWHTDNEEHSNPQSLTKLNRDLVRQRGYVNLRCNWVPGCPDEVQPHRKPKDGRKPFDPVLEASWRELFNNSDIPEVIGVACCAQFAVSRKQILEQGYGYYLHLRQWLLDTTLADGESGTVFEYLWHIIFGAKAVK